MVMPRLKKSGLGPAEMKNYRPISNLPFMSKVIEKLILAQLTRYLTANGLFPKFQSGFRRYVSFHRNSRTQSSLRHLLCHQSRSGLSPCPPRCKCGVWYCGPRNPPQAPLYFIRTLRSGVHMVGVLHHWPSTDHSCWQPPFTSIQGSL